MVRPLRAMAQRLAGITPAFAAIAVRFSAPPSAMVVIPGIEMLAAMKMAPST
jgi:hypothetical protein